MRNALFLFCAAVFLVLTSGCNQSGEPPKTGSNANSTTVITNASPAATQMPAANSNSGSTVNSNAGRPGNANLANRRENEDHERREKQTENRNSRKSDERRENEENERGEREH